ncbi:MAG: PEP-CTERM sorting domain-containing protein [Caldilinea sp. CFX5]|nr:PEP-CTERM sorting domain-containing protein [Caldilinea sp. CFX5]
MKRSAIIRWAVVLTTVALAIAFLLLPGLGAVRTASAQDQVPAVETTVTEVPTATSTNTPLPPTVTPTPTNTPVGPTNTPTQVVTLPPDTPTPTPIPSGPVPIPEPVTVVLFGTGLAALSAALASRRKTEE